MARTVGFRESDAGRFADRSARFFLGLPAERRERLLEVYRGKFGEGAYAYARRIFERWEKGKIAGAGATVRRLIALAPEHIEPSQRFDLLLLLREATLEGQRFSDLRFDVAADDPMGGVGDAVLDLVDGQAKIRVEGREWREWLEGDEAEAMLGMAAEAEIRANVARAADFLGRLKRLQEWRRDIEADVRIIAVFEIATGRVTVELQGPRKRMEHQNEVPRDGDDQLLARWEEMELESRFRSGEVSYPEYVLRNMDQLFTEEERSELRRLAAGHGLELERLLMEIRIKNRTSEQDLEKLLTTLKTLKEKQIEADITSRYETPSGHIEIRARSGRRFPGCLPFMSVLGLLGLVLLWL